MADSANFQTLDNCRSTVYRAILTEAKLLNGISEEIIRAAISVHQEIGPGKLESTYDACLAFELIQCRRKTERQTGFPITYRGHRLDCGYRVDLIVDGLVIVEVKAVERILPVHRAQLRSYLKLLNLKLGLLINFNVVLLRHGIVRIVNGFPE